MRPFSVAYLVPSLDYGGSETLLLSFLKFLDNERFTPEVHCFYHAGKLSQEFRDEGITVHEWNAPKRDPLTFFRMISCLRRKRFDILHTHLFDRQGRVAGYLGGIPVIVTTYHLVTDWDTGGGLSERIKVSIDSLTSRLNDRIIAVSDEVRKNAIEKGGIQADKIVTIPNGIDTSFYRSVPINETLRDELGLRGKRVILAIGRLVEQKGHSYLIRAAGKLKQQYPDISVLIIGEGPLELTLKSQIGQEGLTDEIRLLGVRRDIPELMALSDIYVMPSIYEGLPITLLEAMASEKPIVATSVDGIRGVIEDDVHGLLVPPRDESTLAEALSMLLGNRGLAALLAENSRKTAEENFDIRLHVRRIEDIYLQLAAEKGIVP